MAQSMTTEDKIAHFLKLAEDAGATQAERDSAAAQAERLMFKHGIDRATAMAADTNTDEKIVKRTMFFGGLYGQARMRAAAQIIHALGLRAYRAEAMGVDENASHKGRMTRGFDFHIIGFESDAADAVRILGSLDVQSAVAMKAWAAENKDAWHWASAADKTRAKQNFAVGFGIGAANRIRDERASAVQDAGPGAALVLVDRATKVNEHMNSIPGLGKARNYRLGGGSAAGAAAGRQANTGSSKAISAQRAIGR